MHRTRVAPSTWRRLVQTLAPLLLAGAWGCAPPAARSVLQTDHGGAVAIPNNSDVWPTYYRRKALALIAAQCPDGYEITGEKEVTVERQEPLGRNDNPRWEYFGGLEPASTETAYQIYFRCKTAAPGPAPAPDAGTDRR